MIKDQNIEALREVWDSSTPNFSNKKSLDVKQVNILISDIFSVGDYYFYVVDFSSFPKLNLSFVDQSVVRFFGVDKEKFTFEDVIRNVHPEDIDFCVSCEKVVMEFVTNLSPEDLPFYKYSYSFRVKNKSGKYKVIQHQAIIISAGENGTIAHALNVHTDISHITSSPSRLMSFLGLNGRQSSTGIDPFDPSFDTRNNPLTNREREILNFLERGVHLQGCGGNTRYFGTHNYFAPPIHVKKTRCCQHN